MKQVNVHCPWCCGKFFLHIEMLKTLLLLGDIGMHNPLVGVLSGFVVQLCYTFYSGWQRICLLKHFNSLYHRPSMYLLYQNLLYILYFDLIVYPVNKVWPHALVPSYSKLSVILNIIYASFHAILFYSSPHSFLGIVYVKFFLIVLYWYEYYIYCNRHIETQLAVSLVHAVLVIWH